MPLDLPTSFISRFPSQKATKICNCVKLSQIWTVVINRKCDKKEYFTKDAQIENIYSVLCAVTKKMMRGHAILEIIYVVMNYIPAISWMRSCQNASLFRKNDIAEVGIADADEDER